MSKTFEPIEFDEDSSRLWEIFRTVCVGLEEKLLAGLTDSRARASALTKLEEMYSWIGKAIRDDQRYRERLGELVRPAPKVKR
jgi:hypothetical protein